MSRTFNTDGGYSYNFNPYYHPEKCGLAFLGEIETAGSYEFCTTIALRDVETGELFLAQDSGCSCPTPFDDFNSTGDLIPYENADQVRRLVDAHHYDKPPVVEVQAFIAQIEGAKS